MRILITGATGFAGGHLAESFLAQAGDEIIGLSRKVDWPPEWRHLAGRIQLRACDLQNAAALEAVLRDVKPGQIYHLAGYAHAGRSFQETDAAWNGNLSGTRNLYDAVL